MTLAETQSAVDTLSNSLGGYVTLLLAVGSLSMAFLEVVKGVFNLRRLFHKAQIFAWIGPSKAADELLHLAIGGARNAKALFEQPVEKMFGQIQAAANVALEFPHKYPSLYRFLAEDEEPPAPRVESATPGAQPEASDAELWMQFSADVAGGRMAIGPDVVPPQARAANQARTRIEHLVARKLDALQTLVAFRWARMNQVASIGAGAAVLFIALEPIRMQSPFMAGVLALSGGLLAPLAKDVVSIVGDFRARK